MTTLKIQTQHCRFCNHLLLATTRDLTTLPRRSGESKDKALILPLERTSKSSELSAELEGEAEGEAGAGAQSSSNANVLTGESSKHATLLLATTIPDRRATLFRREDGIEKRVLLRCGRCRVVVGYYLDGVHYSSTTSTSTSGEEGDRPRAVYILPGALVGTEGMGGEGVGEGEWREWAV
ncbi:uncharacterized protein N7511_007145 [Penicillium nucicola]|uniref:uncharacterized protein n=1 Tax=Penicillium nucicola TaxID=1850975 RepID=UPI002545762D|nr:uncharacterized protein N7511_007145 [Penicillium nucicola]KAJ5756963.1 hypothetical protein N7511_007145 [Penicillium nucicola]